MFEWSRLLELAETITWRANRRLARRPIRRANRMVVEELEARLVPTLLGQQLFPADYPWNQNISNAPVAANSAAVISHIGTSIGIHPDWGEDSSSNGDSPLYGIPFNVVHGNSPSVTMVNVIIDNYPGESDIVPVPMPSNPVLEGDYQDGPNPNGGGYNNGQRGDSHLIVWDEDNNIAYELFGVTRPSDPTLFPNTDGVELPHTDDQWHAAQETVWNMNTDTFRSIGETSADAAGLSILAGLARPDEGLPTSEGGQGAIDHALRFTLPSSDVSDQYIYPASHDVSTSAPSTALPLGSRLRLMNTPDVDAAIANMGPEAQILATAMQQYGLVLADIGSPMYVSGASASVDANNNIDLTWNMDDVLGLESLTASDFEVVNLTPQVTGLSETNGSAGDTVTIIGQNFSGAAGNLSVFFGTTAATSVTYVDDAHLTAVVPSGSGTVDVTVQSGVPDTDSANANNPIFGYGTSAVSTADQFTYNSPPVSGSNSTDNFAASSVILGLTDTLTVVVNDTTNSPVTGLPSGAFGFSLSGGTSAGTLGTVTETATQGTYTVAFTGTTAGTASTLTVSVNGVALTAEPTVTVTSVPASPPPPTNSPPPNNPPIGSSTTIVAISPQTVADGSTLTFPVSATNPDGSQLTYSLAAGAPTSARIDPQTGQFTWMPSEFIGIAPGVYDFTVQVASDDDVASATFAVTVGPSSTDVGSEAVARGIVANGLTQSAEYYGNVVTAAYNQYLGRAPDQTGLAYWVAQMQGGLSDEQLEAGFIGSPEFMANHGGGGAPWIQGLYQSLLGRAPQASEVQYWVNELAAGMTPQQVALGFAASPEREAQLVQADYQQYLGRSASPTEVSYWVTAFVSGESNEQVNAGFLSSSEYFQQHGGNVVDWLFAAYHAVLNRQPDTVGYQYWLNQLG